MALTKLAVDKLTWDKKGKSTQILYDEGKVPGFGVRVFPTGGKSFVVWYTTRAGRKRLATLGKFGVLTVEEARDRARKMLGEVLDGKDPVAEQKAQVEPHTVKQFSTIYIDRHAKPHRRSWKEDKRRFDARINPALGKLDLLAVKRSDVNALHAKIGKKHPSEANRVVELIRAMFTKAAAWGYVPHGHPNPAKMARGDDEGIKSFPEKPRRRYVLPSEMPRLWEQINKEPSLHVRAAMQLYLLTGLRRGELLGAKWSDVDLDAREWRIRETKQGEEHVVMLSTAAVAILSSLPRTVGNPHVFTGHKRRTHLVNIDKNWRTARKAAGLEDVTLHDLRRTVGSWLATSGVSLAIVGQVLGHAPGDTAATAIYARLHGDAARKALEDHSAVLMGVVNPKAKADPIEDRLRDLLATGDPKDLAKRLRALAKKVEKRSKS